MSGAPIRYIGILSIATFALSSCGDDGAGQSDAAPQVPTFDASAIDAGAVTRFVASWTLQGGCAGGDVVELDVASDGDGRVTKNRFPCTDTSGTSDHVGTGTFGIELRVIDSTKEMLPDADAGPSPLPGALIAISDRQEGVASVENADTPVTFSFRTNTATITTNWTFVDDEQLAQTCVEAGVTSVSVEYDLFGVGVQQTNTAACGNMSDSAVDLPTGVYVVTAKALDGGGASVLPDVISQVVLYVGNQDQNATAAFAPAP